MPAGLSITSRSASSYTMLRGMSSAASPLGWGAGMSIERMSPAFSLWLGLLAVRPLTVTAPVSMSLTAYEREISAKWSAMALSNRSGAWMGTEDWGLRTDC